MRRPFQLLRTLNLGTSSAPNSREAFIDFSISYFVSCFLLLLMAPRVNCDERSCLFACFWNLPQLHLFESALGAFVIVNWLPLFAKRNFVFHAIIDTPARIIAGLEAGRCRNRLTDSGVKNCRRGADYYRSSEMFCPRVFKTLTACQVRLLH